MQTINWDAVSAITSCIEIIIIFLPALYFFIYFKISFIDWWIYNQNENGMKVAIHNKSKSSIFILDEIIIVKNKKKIQYSIPMISNSDTKFICIKPDDIIYINVDFKQYKITSICDVFMQLEFGGKRKVTKKIVKKTQRG